jgi:hypothetical protein
MTPPRRFKTLDELSPAEHEQRQRAAREGKTGPRFETDEYREARADLLDRHGFDQDEPEPPETHAARRYGDAA